MAVVGSVRYRGPRKKFNKVSFRTVYRILLGHPFIVVTVLYLIILYLYFPFLFSLLVSAAPVLVCTALLLGTLLLHGQPNDSKVGNREERNNGSESLNSGAEYAYPVDKDGNISRERCAERQLHMSRGFIGSDQEYDDAKLNQNQKSEPRFSFTKFDIQDVPRHKLHSQDFDEKYNRTINMQLDAVMQKQSDASFDALVAGVIPTPQETHPLLELEDPLQSQTFPNGNHEAGGESEGQSLDADHSSEYSDDDSDYKDEEEGEKGKTVDVPKRKNDDSRSPFEWTADDQRIIQELRSSEIEKNEHLESLISRAEDDGSVEQEDEDDVASIDDIDDDVDVDDDVDENLDVERDGSKHVTLWTEEDEKNLRHLGCSELERNLRLENLLARRRAKRNFSMISERNLIDLEHSEHPFPIAPISTTRVNPFDVTNDTSHSPSVPPIPGSAPSVTLPRKNPFDSPCTSPKRDQNSHGNGSSSTGYNTTKNVLKPEFGDINRKEALFRRYDSFSTGYNNLVGDPSTHDLMDAGRRDFVLRRHETFNTRSVFPSFFSSNKPVFVPEHVVGELRQTSLVRQSSRDSESVESADSSDDASSIPEYDKHDPEIEETFEDHHDSNAPPNEGMSSDYESSAAIESQYDDRDEHFPESVEMSLDQIYQNQEVLHESHENLDDTSSSSSEHVECSLNESQIEDHAECSVKERSIDEHIECSVNESRTEEHVEGLENERQIEDEEVEGSGFSSKDLNISEASHVSIDDDNHHVDPVYDTSPSSVEKSTAFAHSTQV